MLKVNLFTPGGVGGVGGLGGDRDNTLASGVLLPTTLANVVIETMNPMLWQLCILLLLVKLVKATRVK